MAKSTNGRSPLRQRREKGGCDCHIEMSIMLLKHHEGLTLTARGSTLDVMIWRQIMTSKVDPRAERIKIFIMDVTRVFK